MDLLDHQDLPDQMVTRASQVSAEFRNKDQKVSEAKRANEAVPVQAKPKNLLISPLNTKMDQTEFLVKMEKRDRRVIMVTLETRERREFQVPSVRREKKVFEVGPVVVGHPVLTDTMA